MVKYEVVIGLEIHCQLKTQSKMFCRCDNYSVDASPNVNTCPVCVGMPGTLPVANREAIEWTYLLGLALNAKIAEEFSFERKNYFYPDLPKAYQITSGSNPPVWGGSLEIEAAGITRTVKINHIHLEEDAGKLVHPKSGDHSLVDLNRAGTPLLEIVTEPDLRSPQEAKIFMQDLRSILRHLGVSDANMEQGNLRCDANISLKPVDEKSLGTKVEIKNMNSFKMIERALEYEVVRQSELLDSGEKIVQETRGWNDSKGKTVSQRSKEEANDYRYFPEPDLPPIVSNKGGLSLDKINSKLPELPKEKKNRFIEEYGFSAHLAGALASDLDLSIYFEKTLAEIPQAAKDDIAKRETAKVVANWITGELLAQMNTNSVQIQKILITPQSLAKLLINIDSGKISGKMAKDIFSEMFMHGKDPDIIMKEKNLNQITDTTALNEIVTEVLKDNPGTVQDYLAGKKKAFGFLVGQVMAKTKGQASPKLVNELLHNKFKDK